MPTTAQPRRRRLGLAWLMVAVALVVATATALGITQLQQYAAQRYQLSILLSDMRVAAWQQSAMEWQAVDHKSLTPELAAARVRVDQRADRMSAELARRDPDGSAARAVLQTYRTYDRAIDREFALLAEGRLEEAEQLDEEAVDPNFETLSDALDTADDHYQTVATRAAARAAAGAVGILFVAALIIGSLVWRFQRVRERIFRRVAHQAAHDALTGLPNRTLLHERTAGLIRADDGDGNKAGLLLIDLDRFKEVNDTLGHHTGDRLLIEVARRMRDVLRREDTVARLGGDEFAVLLPHVFSADDLATVAGHLRATLLAPVELDGLSLTVGASVGGALYPEHGDTAEKLLQCADIAMYTAKRSRSGFALFDGNAEHSDPRRLTLASELRHGIADGQLLLHYQPKVDVATRRVLGVEALVRWQHPAYGMIPPAEFVPLAEESDLIGPLTHVVLDAALEQCRIWRLAGTELCVAVNVSAHRLLDPGFPDEVSGLLSRWDIPARLLVVEITESAIMADPARAMHILRQLHTMGVQLSIDDFGTGFSSMAHLQILPVDELKVDRTFVGRMTTSDRDAVIVRSVVELGRNLGLRVVAEGVEDEATVRALAATGCDSMQGFHISRPVPAEELTAWLARQEPATPAVR